MSKGFYIGKLFGIKIQIDWSWLLIFFLISWNLRTSFGQSHPDWGTALSWGIAVLAALLFFSSILAHEIAHSLVARLKGLQVRNITLFLFGGVSNIQRDPPSPSAEFWLTIVGPLTSLVIGAGLLVASGFVIGIDASITMGGVALGEMLSQLGPALTIMVWLGSVNILIGLFNLIPGFPLDGGRILRSIFWALTNNLRKATRWASGVGQLVAWLMIAAGVAMMFNVRIPVLGTGFLNGVWLAFIGWFLNNASIQSYQRVVIDDVLEDVPVSRLMRTNISTVNANINVDSLIHDHIMGSDENAFLVEDGERLVGMIAIDDVKSIARDQWASTPVREVMTPRDNLVSVAPDMDASEALEKLAAGDLRQLPVMDSGKLYGILRRRDIIRWLKLNSESLAG